MCKCSANLHVKADHDIVDGNWENRETNEIDDEKFPSN